jgi:hypothetical protein
MYKWYTDANICHVLLEYVGTARRVIEGAEFDSKGFFANSRWFTRGWTLQELIAPAVVEIYEADWSEIGTRSTLAGHISVITGIRLAVLNGLSVTQSTVAERMSWASERHTTREEDLAYCLLGIFQVNMPLLYGEGKSALISNKPLTPYRISIALLRGTTRFNTSAVISNTFVKP